MTAKANEKKPLKKLFAFTENYAVLHCKAKGGAVQSILASHKEQECKTVWQGRRVHNTLATKKETLQIVVTMKEHFLKKKKVLKSFGNCFENNFHRN